ncbi:hypothetical protein OM427_20545 [Halomonas sp. 18H]|uniref:hypothetical protein n=1 Tax=Halomonas almeriensis TaxID=308163 RepID=UPI00222E405C|nr:MULTISPECIES: hypothetical protein [Halomonas]MCW4151911.1 hypothetical protein [Halomonas sp. 18H]MDN3554148.1 hypothetical protein [Halomonas almeriensis]
MNNSIKIAALTASMTMLSGMAIADHHRGDTSQMHANEGESLVQDGGVQSDHIAERADNGGTLDDKPIIQDGGVQSNYNAKRETHGDLDTDPIVLDGGVQSNHNPEVSN